MFSPQSPKTVTNQAMHPSRRSAAILNHSFFTATWVIAADYEVLGLQVTVATV
jgi:hypothetical protein